MELSERTEGGVGIIDVSGRIVATDSLGRLKEKVTSLIFQGTRQIVVNLTNVSYIDSSGLGELVACHSTATKGAGTVRLAGAGSRVQDLLVMTKLLTVFDSYDTVEAAVASYGPQPV